jgi:hypothetical protein
MALFTQSILTRKVIIPVAQVGGNVVPIMKRILVDELEGKCTTEGFVRQDTVAVVSHSCGLLKQESVIFTVQFECDVTLPVQGQTLMCIVENNTHAGLHCRLKGEGASPFVVFVARDHRHTLSRFASFQEKSEVSVRVVGHRYEVNDRHIDVIGTLNDGVQESGEVDDSIYVAEYVDRLQLDAVKTSPEKTFVFDDSVKQERGSDRFKNIVTLRTARLVSDADLAANKESIDADLDKLKTAKTIVFPRTLGESLRTKSPETFAYLKERLYEVGFQHTPTPEPSVTSEYGSDEDSD